MTLPHLFRDLLAAQLGVTLIRQPQGWVQQYRAIITCPATCDTQATPEEAAAWAAERHCVTPAAVCIVPDGQRAYTVCWCDPVTGETGCQTVAADRATAAADQVHQTRPGLLICGVFYGPQVDQHQLEARLDAADA